MNIFEALNEAGKLRHQAQELKERADALETEWVGAASGDVLTVERLVEIIRKVGEAK